MILTEPYTKFNSFCYILYIISNMPLTVHFKITVLGIELRHMHWLVSYLWQMD